MDTYKATNTTNGKFYIGSTTNFKRRKRAHLTSQENYPFQRALRKNPDAFEWEVWSDDYDEPILEQALLDMWFGKEQCYNLNPNASKGPCLSGADHPSSGKKFPQHSERMSGKGNPNYGKKLPEVSERNSKRREELHPLSKRVEVTYPDGHTEEYPCASSASRSLGCVHTNLAKWARNNYKVRKGNLTGFSFRYV